MLTLTYIHHDCFLLRSDSCSIVFDFFRDAPGRSPGADGLPGFLSLVDPEKPLYVLVSHHHKDHFSRDIFRWQQRLPLTKYIISRDTEKSIRYLLRPDSIYAGARPAPGSVVTLRPGEKYTDELITVNAFGSTDIGNSYVVEIGGRRIFHGGDLNAWVWKDESTPAEIAAAIRDYSAILDDISATIGTRLDIAMLDVDSRIGRDYWEGASILLRRFDVGLFLPMHFCLADSAEELLARQADALRFDLYAPAGATLCVGLTGSYSSLRLPEQ